MTLMLLREALEVLSMISEKLKGDSCHEDKISDTQAVFSSEIKA